MVPTRVRSRPEASNLSRAWLQESGMLLTSMCSISLHSESLDPNSWEKSCALGLIMIVAIDSN